jgi:porphyrinogen peroxidase
MPFGRPGAGEFGTYFIGYAARLWVIDQMLERMFVGVPPGAYDRLLDFSTAITGTTFFVPTAAMLGALAEPPPDRAAATLDGGEASPAAPSSSLGIGSLRGQT